HFLLLGSIWINQDFTRLSRLQPLHRLRKILHCNAVRNYRMQIELAILEQRSHLIPGLVHAAAINALNRDALENNVFRKIQRDGLGSETEKGNASAAPHNVESCSNGVGMTGHFQHRVDPQTAS